VKKIKKCTVDEALKYKAQRKKPYWEDFAVSKYAYDSFIKEFRDNMSLLYTSDFKEEFDITETHKLFDEIEQELMECP